MKDFIAAFIAKVRGAIAKLPLAESIEANGEASWALRNLAECGIQLDMQFPALKGLADVSAVEAEVGKAFGKFLEEHGSAVLAEAETKGLLIPKAAHDLAVATAENTGKEVARKEFEKQAADNAEAAKVRAALVAGGLPAVAAEKIPAGLLVGDQAEANQAKILERVAKLTALGVQASDHAEAFDEPLNAEGDARFERTLSIASKVKASVKVEANAETKKPEGNPAELPPTQTPVLRMI